MIDPDQLTFLLSAYAVESPVVLVSIAACVVILSRRRHAGSGAVWALLGFGLALVAAGVMPVTEWFVQRWVLRSHEPLAQVGFIFTVHASVWSTLRAVSYLLLLAGVFVGRPVPSPVSPFFPRPNEPGL